MTDTDNSKKTPAKPDQSMAASSPEDTNKTVNESAAKSSSGATAGQSESAKLSDTARPMETGASETKKEQSKKEPPKKDAHTTPKKAAQTAPKTPGKPKRPLPITAAVALALGLAVGAASYLNYSRWQMTDLQAQTLANENNKLRSQLGDLQEQISGLQRQDLDFNLQQQRLQEQFSTDLKLQNDSMNQLSQQFQALAADKGKDPMLWRVAEVEFLLSVANHKLVLERDVTTALTALQDADRRLEAIGDPALIPVRKLIASELTALQSVDIPDIAGMALRLSSLVDNIEQLPLVSRERLKTDGEEGASQATISSFSEFMAKVWESLKGVVTIRRSDQPIEPLLPPEEQHYLSQNLGLKLEESRIALLRRDTATFRQNLGDSREWVQRYFDPKAAAVDNVIASVDDLLDVELKPPLPDISGSLREMRRWLKSQQQHQVSALPARVAKPVSKSVSKPASEPVSKTSAEATVDASSDSSTESNHQQAPSPAEVTSGQDSEKNI
ncbi:uroporphyrinogen-III C-methyltransferase [Kaarinaea lacus]